MQLCGENNNTCVRKKLTIRQLKNEKKIFCKVLKKCEKTAELVRHDIYYENCEKMKKCDIGEK